MPDNLDYHPSFLDLPPSQPLPPGFEGVGHAEGVALELNPTCITTSYAFSRGYHCVNCGRLSCRYVSDSWLIDVYLNYLIRSEWEHWKCPNCGVNIFNNWHFSLANVRVAWLISPSPPSGSERVV